MVFLIRAACGGFAVCQSLVLTYEVLSTSEVLRLCSLVVEGTQLRTKSQQVSGSNPRQATFPEESEEIADLVESLDYTAGENLVPEQGSM
jgi:hypothetical protein